MTDQERRSLKCYLTNCLEPALRHASHQHAKFQAAEPTATGLELDLTGKMLRYYAGKISAYTDAISEFKELFAEDLAEREE
jgi:hypothetical protein